MKDLKNHRIPQKLKDRDFEANRDILYELSLSAIAQYAYMALFLRDLRESKDGRIENGQDFLSCWYHYSMVLRTLLY